MVATNPTPRTTYLARIELLEESAVNGNNKDVGLLLTVHHAQRIWHAWSYLKNSLLMAITTTCLTDSKMVDARQQFMCIYKHGGGPARSAFR